MAVGPGGVGIANHDVGRDELAVGQFNTACPPLFDADARHRRVVADGNPTVGQKLHQFTHNRASAAHRRMHTPTTFQRMNKRIDTSHRIGVPANQQRVKAHDDTQLGMPNMLRHQTINGTPGLHAREIGHRFDHVAKRLKSNHAQFLEPELKTTLGGHHQILEALNVLRTDTGDLVQHQLIVVAVIKMCPVVKANSIERGHQPQVDMVLHAPPAQREQLLDQVRQSDDCRASIEGKPVLLVDIGSTAGRIQLLKHLHTVALDTEPDGRSEPPEASTYDYRCRGLCAGAQPDIE